MKDNATHYEFPDFGPDDDTEDMTGVSIFTPISKSKDRFHDNTVLTEIPPELDIYNEGFNYAQEKIDKERESNTR
jgi:hypothetical protein|tara:strand:- start:16744 stop:16968 length:225 start_codon:yes stop_codon:yes gene_type:complete